MHMAVWRCVKNLAGQRR